MDSSNNFSSHFDSNVKMLDTCIRIDESFDLVGRCIKIGSKRAKIYFVDGMIKDETISKVMDLLLKVTDDTLSGIKTSRDFANKFIAYPETDVVADVQKVITFILSGTIGMLVEDYPEAILIDARTYPARSVDEPENDRVLRGPHDGFVETLVFNTALIRRRVRDINLTIDISQIGKRSKTDVVVCYLNNKVDKKMLKNIKDKLSKIDVNSLTMGQESLLECLVTKQKYNPYPRVRYTERPDAAAACIAEGNIIIIVDNSPAALIIPTGIFDFFQDTNDYYFMPLIGSYLRFLRLIVSFAALFLIPIWYLLMKYPAYIPYWLDFIKIEEPNKVPIFTQLIIVEFVIGALKLASLNTPSAMGATFSIVSALVLGEFAVSAQWFVAEVVLYMAFVAVANFAQPNFELAYALKLTRIFYIVSIAILGFWGFVGSVLISIIIVCTTKTVSGKSYLYPVIPFNVKAFSSLFLRRQINNRNN